MYDIFPSGRERKETPYRPTFDVIDLLQTAEKIQWILDKPIVDLKSLPGFVKSHDSLYSLKEDMNYFIGQIKCSDEIILENKDKKEALLARLVKITARIEEMQGFLASLRPSQDYLADSHYTLARKGYYTKYPFKMSELQSAYDEARVEGKVLCIFPDEDKFRRAFRLHLNDLAQPMPVKTDEMQIARV